MKYPQKSIMFQFEEALKCALSRYHISMDDVCIIGSAVLRILQIGDRCNRDVDLVLRPVVRERLINEARLTVRDEATLQLDDKIEAHIDRFKFMGLSDEDIFDRRLYKTVRGYPILLPEILFCYKILRRSKEDTIDLRALNLYTSISPDWNWGKVWEFRQYLLPTPSPVDRDSTKLEKARTVLRHGIELVERAAQNPVWALRAIQRRLGRKLANDKGSLSVRASLSLQSQLVFRIPTGALLGNQFQAGGFARYDVLLRYLAVKSILEGNERYKPFYLRMQRERTGVETYNELGELVSSFQVNGFLPYYPIPITEEGLLIEGAHRLACALYFGIEEIPVTIEPTRERIDYGRPWFEEHGFPKELLSELDSTKDMLFEKYGVWFTLLLWPPVSQWFDEIARKVRSRFSVGREEELYLPDSFSAFVRKVYAVDDIETWKVELKLHAMRGYEPTVRVMLLEIPDPQFRPKARPRSYLSVVGEHLKQWIRSEYSPRVTDYVYDIICHMGDNHRHNREILEIIRTFRQ